MKVTVKDVRQSRFPQAIGLTYDNVPGICAALNEVTQRLITDPRQPETGWWGTWVPALFTVTKNNPWINAPAGVARILLMDVCKDPVKMQNQFYEFLWAGRGYLPKDACCGSGYGGLTSLFTQGIYRGRFPTQVDVSAASYIRAYPTNPSDVGKTVLIQALDSNGLKIYSQTAEAQVEGFTLTLEYPFVESEDIVTKVYGVQKDWTYGDVPLTAVDASTAVETTLARYEPGETAPDYARYYLDSLPQFCCGVGTENMQVNALVKLDYRPVAIDQDWVLIGNIPALIDEAQAVYQSDIQTAEAMQLGMAKHESAIKRLKGELDHYLGKETPAVRVAIFGTASPWMAGIGTLR